ncbi:MULTISPECIES: hypothetical protein [unclassified Streptomyces]|uniref:hypothetical protein n=1 Tax=unclassified Streptomyces TaxID=2593676 RepID=UPI002E2D44A4|nr:hypothetical protein [Streptomyces sp. NBC_00228]
MPSVLGMLEAREKKVREEVARLREEADRVQAALVAAEGALVKLAGARETVAEVLGEQAGQGGELARSAVAGSTVPHRGENAVAQVLAPEYQQILRVLAAPEAAGGMRVKQILAGLGWEATPTRVEGVRSRVKRLAARGWAVEVAPNVFASAMTTASAAAG